MCARNDFARIGIASGAGRRAVSGVRFWLFALPAWIFAMVLVGGATRLTESVFRSRNGSLVGMEPSAASAHHRHRVRHASAMVLSDRAAEGRRLEARLLALEPIVGWWMVSSGLSERTEVAQERLAMHLVIVAATFGVLRWRRPSPTSARAIACGLWTRVGGGFAALVFAQLGLGALVAGLCARLVYNSWPLMDGHWIPSGAFGLSPWPRSIIGSSPIALSSVRSRRRFSRGIAQRTLALAGLAQATLGVATLLLFWYRPAPRSR
jgi:heme A synthase